MRLAHREGLGGSPQCTRTTPRLAGCVAALALLLAAPGCVRGPAAPAGLAGEYSVTSGWPLRLELRADGRYEAFVFNGMGPDGCATVVGAGPSTGSWTWRDSRVVLHPEAEAPDLAQSLAGATAVPGDGGLVVTLAGGEHVLLAAVGRP